MTGCPAHGRTRCAECGFEHGETFRATYAPRSTADLLAAAVGVPRHGASQYAQGCRCPHCRAGHAERMREYKRRKRGRPPVSERPSDEAE